MLHHCTSEWLEGEGKKAFETQFRLFHFVSFYYFIFERERERVRVRGGGGGAEGEDLKQTLC